MNQEKNETMTVGAIVRHSSRHGVPSDIFVDSY